MSVWFNTVLFLSRPRVSLALTNRHQLQSRAIHTPLTRTRLASCKLTSTQNSSTPSRSPSSRATRASSPPWLGRMRYVRCPFAPSMLLPPSMPHPPCILLPPSFNTTIPRSCHLPLPHLPALPFPCLPLVPAPPLPLPLFLFSLCLSSHSSSPLICDCLPSIDCVNGSLTHPTPGPRQRRRQRRPRLRRPGRVREGVGAEGE